MPFKEVVEVKARWWEKNTRSTHDALEKKLEKGLLEHELPIDWGAIAEREQERARRKAERKLERARLNAALASGISREDFDRV